MTVTALDTTFANTATIGPRSSVPRSPGDRDQDTLRIGSIVTLFSVVLFAWDIRSRQRGALQKALVSRPMRR